jgi:anti-sigma factor RsiW
MNGFGASTARSTVDEGELHALVDGRLPAGRRAAVLAHLLTDGGDRERVEAYRRQLAGLARIRAGLDRYAEGFAPELQQALADTVRRVRRRRLMLRGAAGLVAASLLLLAGFGAVRTWQAEPEAVTAIVYEPEFPLPEFPFGGSLGQTATARPEGDRERSLAWLAGHLRDQTLELPDLRGLGLVPVGGQVLTRGSAPAVRLAWTDGQGRMVDLYVGVVSSDAEQAFTMVGESLVSLHWRRGRLVFALVGPAESPELLQVVQAVIAGIGQGGEAVPTGKAAGPAPDPRPIRAAVEPVPSPASPTVAPLPEKAAPAADPAPANPVVPVKVDAEKPKSL